MPKDKKVSSPSKLLMPLSKLFAKPFIKIQSVVLDDDGRSVEDKPIVIDDPVYLEVSNHIHLEDEFPQRLKRRLLIAIGRQVIEVWNQRLRLLVGDTPVLFYLGGTDTVMLRFHQEHEGYIPWIADHEHLRRGRISLYRGTRDGVEAVVQVD